MVAPASRIEIVMKDLNYFNNALWFMFMIEGESWKWDESYRLLREMMSHSQYLGYNLSHWDNKNICGIHGPLIWSEFPKGDGGSTDGRISPNFKKRACEDPRTADLVRIFKNGCRDPRMVETVRMFKGECRDLRTAKPIRIFKLGIRDP